MSRFLPNWSDHTRRMNLLGFVSSTLSFFDPGSLATRRQHSNSYSPFRQLSTESKKTRLFTRFGVGLEDFDNDGTLDLYEANGKVRQLNDLVYDQRDVFAEPNLLLRGVAPGQFQEVLPRGGTASLLVHASRGAALQMATRAVGEKAASDPSLTNMGTTFVAVTVNGDEMRWVSVGDSPLYLVAGGRIERLNADHSMAPQSSRVVPAFGRGRFALASNHWGRSQPFDSKKCAPSAICWAYQGARRSPRGFEI